MLHRTSFFIIVSLLMAGLSAQELALKQTDTGYEIQIGDKLFAGYITDLNGTPIVYPIVGPTGKNMTRDYPMKRGYEGVKADHPHHRSLWFTHGDVNKLDFWATRSKIIHNRFVKS
jgi:hypothetical protein